MAELQVILPDLAFDEILGNGSEGRKYVNPAMGLVSGYMEDAVEELNFGEYLYAWE